MGETVPEVLSTASGGTQTEGTVSPNTNRPRPVNNIFIFFLLIFKSFRERQGLGPRTDDVLQLLQLAKRSPYERRYDADKNSSNWRKCQICRNYVYSREIYSLHT